jgi:HEAT repeat protein
MWLLKWKLKASDPAKRLAAINEVLISRDPRATALVAEALIRSIDLAKAAHNRPSGSKGDSVKDIIDNANVQRAAAEALGELRDHSAVDALLRALDDGSEAYVRIAAAAALGRIKDRRAVAPLLAVLSKSKYGWGLLAGAAAALGEIGDASAVGPLQSLLSRAQERYNDLSPRVDPAYNPNPAARQLVQQDLAEVSAALKEIPEALRKLGKTSLSSATPLPQATPKPPAITKEPAKSLPPQSLPDASRSVKPDTGKLASEPNIQIELRRLLALEGNEAEAEAEKLGRSGKFELLVAWLREAKYFGIPGKILRESGDAKAAEMVISLLDSPDFDIRVRAAATLGPLGGERAAAALCSILPKATGRGRELHNIGWALDRLAWKGAVEPLMTALEQTTERHAMTSLVNALSKCGAGDRGFAVLIGGLSRGDEIAWQCVAALNDLSSPCAVAEVKVLLQRTRNQDLIRIAKMYLQTHKAI